jgi:hypothetical protein
MGDAKVNPTIKDPSVGSTAANGDPFVSQELGIVAAVHFLQS